LAGVVTRMLTGIETWLLAHSGPSTLCRRKQQQQCKDNFSSVVTHGCSSQQQQQQQVALGHSDLSNNCKHRKQNHRRKRTYNNSLLALGCT
jgi:hypothetical protein